VHLTALHLPSKFLLLLSAQVSAQLQLEDLVQLLAPKTPKQLRERARHECTHTPYDCQDADASETSSSAKLHAAPPMVPTPHSTEPLDATPSSLSSTRCDTFDEGFETSAQHLPKNHANQQLSSAQWSILQVVAKQW
jgi:hypothetical protein